MSVMGWLLGTLVIAIGVAIAIAVHELGHLLPAKLFGVKCTQYMIGMGPTLWSTRRGETEYGLKAIPVGGYVRMIGMLPPARRRWSPAPDAPPGSGSGSADHRGGGAAPAHGAPGRWSRLIEQARSDSFREVRPEDDGRLFYQRSPGRRLIIMLGGPTMNLVLATVLIGIVISGFGLMTTTTKLSSVSDCVQSSAVAPNTPCTPADPVAPAKVAGLRPGDVIRSFDGHPVTQWQDLSPLIRAAGGRAATVVVDRAGEQVTLTVTPLLTKREVMADDGSTTMREIGFLGVVGSRERVPASVLEVPGQVGSALGDISAIVLTIPQRMWAVLQSVVGEGERDMNSPISLVGLVRVSGEVSAAGETPVDWLSDQLMLLASLNLALFVFNLIPLLPLDGGHVAGALWEGLRRRVARVLRRPDPGPVDVARALPLAYGVVSLLIGMSVLLIYADIVNPIRLGG